MSTFGIEQSKPAFIKGLQAQKILSATSILVWTQLDFLHNVKEPKSGWTRIADLIFAALSLQRTLASMRLYGAWVYHTSSPKT